MDVMRDNSAHFRAAGASPARGELANHQRIKAGSERIAASCLVWVLCLLLSVDALAKIGIEYQAALGSPTPASANAGARTDFLIARPQYALSYNDDTHQANWVSWSYSSEDSGSSGRTDAWSVETALPTGYLRIGTSSFGTGWDRGHMCPSADRTASVADNEFTFRMSNIIPQASSNNQGLWANFETYCRSMAADGSEILIISGPSEFTGTTLSNGMRIPGSVWKIAVKVPDGAGSAASRVDETCRTIALLTPNVSSGLGTWQSYITSVEEIEDVTGYDFFTAVEPQIANYLKNVVDTGTGPNTPTVITSIYPNSGAVGALVTISGYHFGSAPAVSFNGVAAQIVTKSDTEVQVRVPSDASSGDITVTGSGGMDTSGSPFTVLAAAEPNLSVSISNLGGFSTVEGAASLSQSYTLTGENLTGGVTVAAPADYELSLDREAFSSSLTVNPIAGMISSLTVHVRIRAGAMVGPLSGVIAHSGGGSIPQNLGVSGLVISTSPQVTLSNSSLSGFTSTQDEAGPSKSYTISGSSLDGGLTVEAPVGFEISMDGVSYSTILNLQPQAGILSNVRVQVRMQASPNLGPVSGVIRHQGGGAIPKELSVSGTVRIPTVELTTLAAWEVSGLISYGPSPMAATKAGSGLTVGGLTRGAGITISGTAAGNAWGGNGFDAGATFETALTAGDTIRFSVTPSSGFSVSFAKIPSYTIRRSSTGPVQGQWQYQVGGGNFVNLGAAITWGVIGTSTTSVQPEIDLSGFQDLQTVTAGTVVTFRLVNYGASSSTGTFYIYDMGGDDLALLGAVASSTAATPVIESALTVAGVSFEEFSYQILASNTPSSFAAAGLPDGLVLHPESGLISGAAVVPGIYPVILTATNGGGDGTANLEITIAPNPGAPVIESGRVFRGLLRSVFDEQVPASNAPTAYFSSALPPGLALDSASGRIRGTPSEAGVWEVDVTVQNSLGSDTESIAIEILNPLLEILPAVLDGFSADLGSPSPVKTYRLTGTNLTGSIEVLAPSGFELSLDATNFSGNLSIPVVESGISTLVSVRLSSAAGLGEHVGSIIHAGGGAIPQYLPISGVVSAAEPTLGISVASLEGFSSFAGVPSVSQTYTVSGVNLTGAITVAAPVNYEVSLDGTNFSDHVVLNASSGNFVPTTVYVRIAATAGEGALLGTITHTGGGAISQSLVVSGTVKVASGPVISSSRSGSVYAGTAFNYAIRVDGGPVMLGYAAVGLPAGLSINPSNGVISGVPSVAGSYDFQISATSTEGTSIAVYSLKVMSPAEQAAIPLSVVINKYLNGGTDVIELLVTGDGVVGSRVDLRGMVLKDFTLGMNEDQGGKFIFSDAPLWASVRPGTLLVLSAGQQEIEDLDPADFVLRVNLGSSTWFSMASGGFDIANTDMVMLKAHGTGVDGVAGGIHALATGSSGAQYTGFLGRKTKARQAMSSNRGYYVYVANPDSQLLDYQIGDGGALARRLVFGSSNNSQNEIYISSLRAVDLDPPVLTVIGENPLTIGHSQNYVELGATAVDLNDGVLGVSTMGAVDTALVGIYTITYTASDLAGNVGSATRTVAVTDQAAPTLTMNGPAQVRIPLGSVFDDPGATAVDAVDVSVAVEILGEVDFQSLGTYIINYQARDAAGNDAQPVSRTLEVVSAFEYAMVDVLGLEGDDAAAGGDPDGDGWSNFQEYAFGQDPLVMGGNLVEIGRAVGVLKIAYLQRDGISYEVLESEDLMTWSSAGVFAAASASQPAGLPSGVVRVEVEIPLASGNRFLRVEAITR